MTIQFYLNGELRQENAVSPTTTVLDYLRVSAGKTGTKEGCAEGDCGACTIVVVRKNKDDEPLYEAVNSCLLILPQLDGANVVTVEGLAKDGNFDPVQTAMVESDGTQCGFCTPGFIMALFALRQGNEKITDGTIHDALAGNLCRCTGYSPIVQAAHQACQDATKDLYGELIPLIPGEGYKHNHQMFFAPQDLSQLAEIRTDYPKAMMLAGGTDLGLLFSKDRDPLEAIIYTSSVAELGEIEETKDYLEIGAAVTYTRILPYFERLYPSFATLITRIGSRQIRNVGTLGGNIGTASPIGDTLPCLIALDATLTLFSKGGHRELPLEDFFVAYRKTDLKPGEFIKSIRIPKLKDEQKFRAYKISKRYDQDISSVIGAYRIEIDGLKVKDIRIAFGGMAEIPRRAAACEGAFLDKEWVEDTALKAGLEVATDFKPLSDHRATKDYRLCVAANLFIRLYRDLTDAEDLMEVVAA